MIVIPLLSFILQHFIDFKRQVLDDYENRLEQSLKRYLQEKHHELALLKTKLEGLDITQLLKQGYTLTLHEGKIQTSKEGLTSGQKLETVFEDGKIESTID